MQIGMRESILPHIYKLKNKKKGRIIAIPPTTEVMGFLAITAHDIKGENNESEEEGKSRGECSRIVVK